MATVFLGSLEGALGFRQLVAIKRLHPHLVEDPGFREALLAEARLAAGIHHANVVDVRDVEAVGDAVQLVMDYIEGASLGELVRACASEGRHLPAGVAVRVVLDACAGLHAAHELTGDTGRALGLVHRDVSPQNVLVGIDGVARVTDFGIAKCIETSDPGTSRESLKGKVGYMAPEYVRGETVDRRVDVFALGVVLWEALCGRRLFRGQSDAETLERVLSATVPPVSEVSPELAPLDAVVARALHRDPALRFPTTEAMAHESSPPRRTASSPAHPTWGASFARRLDHGSTSGGVPFGEARTEPAAPPGPETPRSSWSPRRPCPSRHPAGSRAFAWPSSSPESSWSPAPAPSPSRAHAGHPRLRSSVTAPTSPASTVVTAPPDHRTDGVAFPGIGCLPVLPTRRRARPPRRRPTCLPRTPTPAGNDDARPLPRGRDLPHRSQAHAARLVPRARRRRRAEPRRDGLRHHRRCTGRRGRGQRPHPRRSDRIPRALRGHPARRHARAARPREHQRHLGRGRAAPRRRRAPRRHRARGLLGVPCRRRRGTRVRRAERARVVRRAGGSEPRDATPLRRPRARRRHRRHGARRGRDGHGQGRARAVAPRRVGARGGALRGRRLRRHPREPHRERAVRARARRLHGRDGRPAGRLRRGARGDALPRRDRRDAAHRAGQAPARHRVALGASRRGAARPVPSTCGSSRPPTGLSPAA